MSQKVADDLTCHTHRDLGEKSNYFVRILSTIQKFKEVKIAAVTEAIVPVLVTMKGDTGRQQFRTQNTCADVFSHTEAVAEAETDHLQQDAWSNFREARQNLFRWSIGKNQFGNRAQLQI